MIEGGSSPPPQEGDEALCVWLQAWSVPEAVVLETAFTLKVGAKAADERPLAGAVIEVIDDGEAVLARGTLGEAPWPDTAALYWTEIELPAPQKAGQHTWRARLVALPQETVFEIGRAHV